MRPLSAHRQTAPVSQAPIAAEVHQPLDVHRHFASQISLDHVLAVDHLADLQDLLVGQLRHPPGVGDSDLCHDFLGLGGPDSMDVLQRNNDALVGRDIDTCDAGQGVLSCRPAFRAELIDNVQVLKPKK